jgi:peptidoglycan hydrolase CwlO-like protein
MYRDKQYFLTTLSDLTELEQRSLIEAFNELGYKLPPDENLQCELHSVESGLEELQDEVNDLQRDITNLQTAVHERDLALEEIKELSTRFEK